MSFIVSASRRVNLQLWLLLVGAIALYAAYADITTAGLQRTQLLLALRRAIYPLLFGACIFCIWELVSLSRPAATKRILPWLAVIGGWVWFLLAGGGGFGLLLLRGPWPPTNGWFALMSGLAACPLIGRLLGKSAHLKVSGWQQFSAAVLFITLGRLALTVWPQVHPL